MNWTEESFQIVNRLPRTPVVYEVRDLLERVIEGTFYEKELQKVKRPDIFRVEKVLKKRIKNKSILCDGLNTILISIIGFNALILKR